MNWILFRISSCLTFERMVLIGGSIVGCQDFELSLYSADLSDALQLDVRVKDRYELLCSPTSMSSSVVPSNQLLYLQP